MVHLIPDANVENNIVVVAYLYKVGKPDKFLSKVKSPERLVLLRSKFTESDRLKNDVVVFHLFNFRHQHNTSFREQIW